MEMMFQVTRTIRKTITALAIIKSLREVGVSDEEQVCDKLQQYYRCSISDCFDNPQYLRKVLDEIYGDRSREITKLIHHNLGEDANHISTEYFLEALSN